jgi:hypothetical protein
MKIKDLEEFRSVVEIVLVFTLSIILLVLLTIFSLNLIHQNRDDAKIDICIKAQKNNISLESCKGVR